MTYSNMQEMSSISHSLANVLYNDLPLAVHDCKVFTDDTNLCYHCVDITQLNEVVNTDLKKLDIWLQGNKLTLNIVKTHSVLVSGKQKHNVLKNRNDDAGLKIRENTLQAERNTKYLGV